MFLVKQLIDPIDFHSIFPFLWTVWSSMFLKRTMFLSVFSRKKEIHTAFEQLVLVCMIHHF